MQNTELESQLNELLNFVSAHNDWEDIVVLMARGQDFLLELDENALFYVHSCPVKNDGKYGPLGKKAYFRHVWSTSNKAKVKRDDALSVLKKMNRKSSLIEIEKNLIAFEIGVTGGQAYIGYIKKFNFEDEAILKHFVRFIRNAFRVTSRLSELNRAKALVHTDDVTGLYNQRKMDMDIEASIEIYNKVKKSFSLLFIDIDHFKQVNDGFGHVTGTRILSELGKILKDVMRETDLIYRYGGDEFVMIIPGVDSKSATKIGERVLKSIKKRTFHLDNGKPFKLSVSIGVAEYPKDAKSKSEIIEIADQMMYFAKSSGRGRVCWAGNMGKKGRK